MDRLIPHISTTEAILSVIITIGFIIVMGGVLYLMIK